MSYLMDATASELATDLEIAAGFTHNTGSLSMLDEATLAWAARYPDVAPLQRAFATARHVHMSSWSPVDHAYSDRAWNDAASAARALAAAMRSLGDARIARCKRQTGWGTCNFPLSEDGACRGTSHTDGASGS